MAKATLKTTHILSFSSQGVARAGKAINKEELVS